jgi:hypothetical protein
MLPHQGGEKKEIPPVREFCFSTLPLDQPKIGRLKKSSPITQGGEKQIQPLPQRPTPPGI